MAIAQLARIFAVMKIWLPVHDAWSKEVLFRAAALRLGFCDSYDVAPQLIGYDGRHTEAMRIFKQCGGRGPAATDSA